MAAIQRRRWTPARIVLLVLGIIATLVALGLLAGGGALLWAQQTQRDHEGYFTTSSKPFVTSSYALATKSLDVANDGPDWLFKSGRLGRIRIRATSTKPIFLGIARAAAVSDYLGSSSYTEVKDVDYHPFHTVYVPHPGSRKPADPAAEHIWVASASGPDTQTLTWPIEKGRWSVVLMNADASPRVEADVSVGAKITWLVWLIVGLLAAGALTLFAGGLLIFLGVRRRAGVDAAAGPVPELPAAVLEAQTYPVAVEGELDPGLSRWLWLVKWLLAIPHYIVLFFLGLAFIVLSVIAFFAILFTGRYPRGIFDVNVGILRWSWRVGFYAFALGTDRYPPFTLDPVAYPASIEIPYPERLSRGLVLVKWWLLAIPHYIVLSVLAGGWSAWAWHGGSENWHVQAPGLVHVLALFAGVMLLFTGQYPQDLYRLVLGINRWFFRVVAYASLMRDEYPPFRFER